MLGCGCDEQAVITDGHVGCEWNGAAALDYPGVQAWQRWLGSSAERIAQVVHQAQLDGAPFDALYPSYDQVWRTLSDVLAALPGQRVASEQKC